MEIEESNIKGHKLDHDNALEFLLGGNSLFTVKNTETGNHQTYTVVLSKKSNTPMYFVKVKPGKFIGTIFDKSKFVYSKKSELPIDSPEVKGFAFVFYRLLQKALPDKVEIWHAGKCCRCGRVLTDLQSVRLGIGPECRRKTYDQLSAAMRGNKKMNDEYDRIFRK